MDEKSRYEHEHAQEKPISGRSSMIEAEIIDRADW